MKAYLANSLFSLGDRLVNEKVAEEVRKQLPGVELYVPQENGEINDKNSFANSIMIADGDNERLMESDFLIAVIDGNEIDSGVAAEIGIFYTFQKPIYALFTDVRQQGTSNIEKLNALTNDATENQFVYRNLYVIGLIKQRGKIFSDVRELARRIRDDVYNGGPFND